MKRFSFLGLAVSLFLVCAPLIHSQNAVVDNIPLRIDAGKLSYYLELEPFRKNEVYQIIDFFIDQQNQFLTGISSPEKLQKNFDRVLYGNLKLMKEALTDNQYKKYLRLINTTFNNRMLESV
jgi:hypothetical protein